MAAPCGGPGPPEPPAAAAAGPGPGPSGGAGPRVCFAAGPEAAEEAAGRRQGKVTVRYDRRELRKRLHLEEWILAQLTALYDCRVPAPRPLGPAPPARYPPGHAPLAPATPLLDPAHFPGPTPRPATPTLQAPPNWPSDPPRPCPWSVSIWPPFIGAPFYCPPIFIFAPPPLFFVSPPPRRREIPELEIDVDELLEMESDGARSARVQEILVDCYKPTEAFVCDLLDKIRGMQKLNTPQKK
ncbi:LOW QUALITY PROTEIN: protein phosphatase 1 regulatory subunit 14B-like [Anser cygnoides]|uniref:LOW QUALITY PROTEIN: protein phosphatase 1 regulatory subunit 14B-like n=1 Tax=Anser cygnoides TaxID=8845 RepID=UPI0034D37E40